MITLALVLFAGLCNANMDALKFRWGHYRWAERLYKYAGPNSWKNKYKQRDPEQGPRFFLSTTALVFLTDFWHLSQFLWRISMTLAIVFYGPHFGPIIDFLILSAAYLLMFNLGFEKIFVCKK
jgi:hypothetical protein